MRCRNFNKVLFVGDAGKCWVENLEIFVFWEENSTLKFDVKSLKNSKIAFKNVSEQFQRKSELPIQ